MKNPKFEKYIYWGVTAILTAIAFFLFAFVMLKGSVVKAFLDKINGILAPVFYGAVMAFLMSPIYNRTTQRIEQLWSGKKTETLRRRLACSTASFVCVILILIVLTGLFLMLVPELITSVRGIVEALPDNARNLTFWLEDLLNNKIDTDVQQAILNSYTKVTESLEKWVDNSLMPNLNRIVGMASSGVWYLIIWIKNFFIGLIVMVYLLNIKSTLSAQAKKIIFSIVTVKKANRIIGEARRVHKVFSSFIIGKLLDSFIIGILCFICLNFMKMPYTLLISVIVGVTNIIPFFGPFIGAVPSAVLLLFASPVKCFYFLIFILLLQQLDGNIIGPKILGDSTGLSGFWVLFSILVFGGLLGPIGMIVGVPVFAVIYQWISEWTSIELKKKKLPVETADYQKMDRIEESEGSFVIKKKEK